MTLIKAPMIMQVTPQKYLRYMAAVSAIDQKQLLDDGKAHVIAALMDNSVLSQIRAKFAEEGQDPLVVTDQQLEAEYLPLLTQRGWIEELMDRLMDKRKLPLLFPLGLKAVDAGYFNALEVFANDRMSVLLSRVDRTRLGSQMEQDGKINITTFSTYLYFVRGGNTRIAIYDAKPGLSCQVSERFVSDGTLIKIEGGRHSMKFISADADPLVLGINVFGSKSHLVYRIDSDSGKLHARATTDMYIQRAFMYSSLLRLLDRVDAVQTLSQLLNHEDEELRWHVVREMLAIDVDSARQHLLYLADHDPSARVRDMASVTARKFGLMHDSVL